MPALANAPSSVSRRFAMLTNIAFGFAGGYADASSYLLAGSFTGHLTGNTVLAAIALVSMDRHNIVTPLLAIALFLCGTAIGFMLGRFKRRGIEPLLIAVPLEIILVACASMGNSLHLAEPRTTIVPCLCLALGIQNGVFRKAEGVSVHATYVTGDATSLVLSLLSTGPHSRGSASGAQAGSVTTREVLGLAWLSFGCGAFLSALAVPHLGISALWVLEFPILLAGYWSWESSAARPSLPPDSSST